VRVLHALVDRPLAQPRDAEAARPDALQRVAAGLAERDGPVARAVAAGLREPGGRRPRGRGGRRRAALGDRGAVGDERARDREPDEDRARPAGKRRAAAHPPCGAHVGERRERHDREQERAADEALALA